jgi:hypothetical protein
MRERLMPLLDALPATVDAFIRDDDAGWGDARLFSLLDVTERAGVPIDLAAIPTAMNAPLAAELRARMAATTIGVHQHGFAHANHEPTGRKCEFGMARSADAQRADIAAGQALLRVHFGALLQPIFTPPWNRCTETTPALLRELGLELLSRDRGATPLQHSLAELPVDVDWSRAWREGGATGVIAALSAALRARAADGRPLGLMLHHAVMGADELALLATLPASHPKLRWRAMRELLPQPTSTRCATTA